MNAYQTIVLSGGGSKGPYGLGVLLALDKYHKERAKQITKIYCGTSVGALNATLAAQGDLDQLRTLYSEIRTRHILGTDRSTVTKLGMLWVLGRKPFHYFKNDALRATITKYVRFSALHDAHLLICATNYSTGELETFYISRLIDEFIEQDQAQPLEKRRLINYHRIESQEHLVEALLASTAIPFYLPPVKIKKSLYVDGGVGNNTPLRQAAYISRFLGRRADSQLEPTFCVINDPLRFTIDGAASNDIFGVIHRTMNIFHNELLNDSHISWDRINQEVMNAQERKNLLESHIEGLEGLGEDVTAKLKEHVGQALRGTSSATARLVLPLLIVRPSAPLVKDILHFNPTNAKRLKEQGIADCLTCLEHKSFITHNDLRRWNEELE
ncbi:MAG: patatin-like phospholipase family protein [Betaproteobacteria bacterium]|nr:patatin-like phospholipase family protein [Betaproteobacteria bacterium]